MIDVQYLSKCFSLNRQQQYALGQDATQHKALDSISFQCEVGRVLLILGTKNSGKTTLLQILCGMIPADTGRVTVMGYDIGTQSAEARQKMAFISSKPAFYGYLTVTEQLAYFAQLNGVSKNVLKEKIPNLLNQWKLESLAKTNIHRLSDEQRRYLCIAQCLLHDPELLLLDEPTSGLDTFTAQPFVELVDYAKAQGKTVVFSTNNISKAELLGDDVMILHQGRILHQSTLADFKQVAAGNNAQAFLEIVSSQKSNL